MPVTFHDLRHDWAHRARAAGWSLEEIAVYAGHQTRDGAPAIATTVRYTLPSRQLMQYLLPLAMESDRPIPLVEAALDLLRSMKVIAPSMTTLEQLIVRVLRRGERRVQQLLLQPLTADHKAVTWLVGNEELANGERVGLGQREERGLKRGGVIRGVVASRLIAGMPGWFSLHDSACRCHEGSPPQVKAVERSVAPGTLWVWAPDAVVQSTAPMTSTYDRSAMGR